MGLQKRADTFNLLVPLLRTCTKLSHECSQIRQRAAEFGISAARAMMEHPAVVVGRAAATCLLSVGGGCGRARALGVEVGVEVVERYFYRVPRGSVLGTCKMAWILCVASRYVQWTRACV